MRLFAQYPAKVSNRIVPVTMLAGKNMIFLPPLLFQICFIFVSYLYYFIFVPIFWPIMFYLWCSNCRWYICLFFKINSKVIQFTINSNYNFRYYFVATSMTILFGGGFLIFCMQIIYEKWNKVNCHQSIRSF